MFNLAIYSKLRGCDLVRLQVDDVCVGGRVRDRGTVIQKKTGRPVQFEITEQTRGLDPRLAVEGRNSGMGAICSRAASEPNRTSLPGNTLASSMPGWRVRGSTVRAYGTHSMRRTKVAQIYRNTGNLRSGQLLLGHTKLESTVRYLGIEVDDALSISEQVEL